MHAPLVVQGGKVHMLDLAAKLDSTAEYLCKLNWGDVEFPPPFGRDALPEVKILCMCVCIHMRVGGVGVTENFVEDLICPLMCTRATPQHKRKK